MTVPETVAGIVDAALGHLKAKQFQRAIELCEEARRSHPEAAAIHAQLAGALHLSGRVQDAIPSYVKALELGGYDKEVVNNLSVGLAQLGGLPDPFPAPTHAISNTEAALQLRELGIGFLRLRQLPQGIALFQAAERLAPDDLDILLSVGNAYEQAGQIARALELYGRAADLAPQRADIQRGWGLALARAGQMEDALLRYKRSLELDPAFAEGYDIFGQMLNGLGRTAEAGEYFRAAIERGVLDPILRNAPVPVIAQSRDQILDARRALGDALTALAEKPGRILNPEPVASRISFYLAYHNESNRRLKEALSKALRAKAPWLNFTAEHCSRPSVIRDDGKVRIGFLSEFLHNHTIGVLNRGLIKRLDRRYFHVTIIRLPGIINPSAQEIDALADRVLMLPGSGGVVEGKASFIAQDIARQREAIAREGFDVVFYPDIAMSAATHLLAHARLAPVQATTWGHPDTTGIDTMDYFVSSRSMEPDGSGAYYSECLIKLDHLCCYERKWMPHTSATRKDLGLPSAGTLYGCLQTLFKIHPDFDAVMAAIMQGDPNGRIVMIEADRAWAEALRQRWRANHPILAQRVLFLPRLSSEKFAEVSARCDVMLDPIYYGGGNTVYEALVYGTPVVTLPGPFTRANIAAGIYRQMKLTDAPICRNVKEYVQAALTLGKNEKKREKLRRKLKARADAVLFEDEGTVREFECFFRDAVAAAKRGERLDSNWKASM